MHGINYITGLNARKPVLGVCEQQRCRSACASAQSDQRLVILSLESIISSLDMSEISIFYLFSVYSWGDWLEFCFVRNPEVMFCREAKCLSLILCLKTLMRPGSLL